MQADPNRAWQSVPPFQIVRMKNNQYEITWITSIIKCALLLIGSNFLLPIWAQHNQTNTQTAPNADFHLPSQKLFYWHLNARYINDFQNGNLFINIDDRYTYGINTTFSLNNWDLVLDYKALTDRYLSRTRTDEMRLSLSYVWGNWLSPHFWHLRPSRYNRRSHYQKNEKTYLGLKLTAGYFQAGNIQGETIQNSAHNLSMVPKVYGKYLPSVYTALLGAEIYFSYTFGLKKLLPTWEDGALELGVVGQGETALGYQQSFRLGVRSKLYSGNQYLQWDFYLQQLGYYRGFGKPNTVESLWSDTKTAFWLAFSSRSGLYQRRVDLSFGSLQARNWTDQRAYPFGFGSLEFSWAYLEKPKRFIQADYSQTLLIGLAESMVVDRFSWFFRIAKKIPADFSLVAVRSLLGDQRLFMGNSLARFAESVWLGMFHIRPTINLKKFGFLEFYAGFGTGVVAIETFQSIKVLSLRNFYQYFTLAGGFGLRWYGLALRRDAAVYGLEFGLLSHYPFHDQNYVRFGTNELYISSLKPKIHFLFGVTILSDW